MKKLLVVAALSLFLVGCGEPKIDASSDAAMKESIAAVQKDLSDSDKVKFNKSIMRIIAQVGFDFKTTEEEKDKALRAKLDGKTAKEIIEMGENKAK